MRSEKSKSAKTPADRYAATLTEAINSMAVNGWEYLRAETLPSEERSGLTGRTTLFHNLLIFRRAVEAAAPAHIPAETATPRIEPAPPRPEAAKPAPAPAPALAPAEPSPVFSEKMPVSEPAAEKPEAGKPLAETAEKPAG